ncbi:MAG: 23S rRNA (pseudouridine(1915)-N(3))-methyltransferase RlmH [Clostridia bacterium]|nr:23S rRNA (pseudouridine(1915)-N(3))-methyltransferase RlmH [Clostridia bacterium]
MGYLTVITVGSLKEKYLIAAKDEYKKRLGAYTRVEEIELKEEKISNEDDKKEIERALECEADRILAAIPKGAMTVALAVEGKQYSSEELARLIGGAESGKVCLIIGSSHGMSERVKRAADVRLSFSRLTFPHQLMRVILFEALYRSHTILAGKRYHK